MRPTSLFALLTLLLTAPAVASPSIGQGELVVAGALAGRSWSQAPCKPADGCSGGPDGFWRLEQRDPRVALAVSGRWFLSRSPFGLAARYRLASRPAPRATAAGDLPDALEHHLECRIAARLRTPGPRPVQVTPELGWDLRTWYAWETPSGGLLAEHRIVAHLLGVGLSVAGALSPAVELEARLTVDLLPRVGGISLSEGSLEVGLTWSSGPLLARATAVARAGGITATRERAGLTEGVRLGVVDLGLEVGAGFRF